MTDEKPIAGETIRIVLSQDALYNAIVHESAMQAGEITVCTKAKGTVNGLPVAVIHFASVIEGRIIDVQATTTVKNLISLGSILLQAYPELFNQSPGIIISTDKGGN